MPTFDVVIVGAGPAGSVAATVLARAGARVRLLDRATFPREKLCGDTVNPGTLAILRRLHMAEPIESRGLRVEGMLVTGEGGVAPVRIVGRYPGGLAGRVLPRSELDWLLVQEAMRAGATFEPGVAVRGAVMGDARGTTTVRGVTIASRGTAAGGNMLARVTIGADGRRSTLAFGLGLARHPEHPRRWAIGAYAEGVEGGVQGAVKGAGALGEMHIRRDRYIGVAPMGGGRTNVCLVKPSGAGDAEFGEPMAVLRRALEEEPVLADRFRHARFMAAPVVLGPLAVDAAGESIDGLLLAGDASGFVDPITGDGLRFAVRGGELAALAALDAIEHGWNGVHARLRAARRREFASKWRFNRALRALVASPIAVRSAAAAARLSPGLVRAIVARAGDCDLAESRP
jgi:flavin-dependent dehydrogenase